MEYREILVDEIEVVARLHDELVYYIQKETGDDYWNFGVLPKETLNKHLETFLGQADRKIFIAKEEKMIIGFIAGEIIKCHLPISSVKKVGYISGAYVLPQYRGKGIMKALEKLMATYFKDCGLKFMELNFISRNLTAKKSWEALGYQTFSEQARKRI